MHGVWEQGDELSTLKLFPAETFDEREIFILESLRSKLGKKKGRNFFASGTTLRLKLRAIEILPWECLA